jgi:hypothetical protein
LPKCLERIVIWLSSYIYYFRFYAKKILLKVKLFIVLSIIKNLQFLVIDLIDNWLSYIKPCSYYWLLFCYFLLVLVIYRHPLPHLLHISWNFTTLIIVKLLKFIFILSLFYQSLSAHITVVPELGLDGHWKIYLWIKCHIKIIFIHKIGAIATASKAKVFCLNDIKYFSYLYCIFWIKSVGK